MAHKVEKCLFYGPLQKKSADPCSRRVTSRGYICWERGGWLPLGWMPADAAGTRLNRKGGIEENGGGLIGTAKH